MKEYKIYCILNKINNKRYIGQTCQKFECRINRHFNDFKNNKHVNEFLQRSYNKYGKESFEYFLLEDNIQNLKDSNNKEKYYIDFYNTLNREKGYNLMYHHSHPMLQVTKEKIKKTSLENGLKDIKIVRYDIKTGLLIDIWDSANKCERSTKIRASNIIQHMNGNKKHTHVCGYGFIRYDDYIKNGLKKDENFKKRKSRLKPIKSINLNTGEEKIFESTKDAYIFFGLKKSESIHRVLRGERKKYKDTKFEYLQINNSL